MRKLTLQVFHHNVASQAEAVGPFNVGLIGSTCTALPGSDSFDFCPDRPSAPLSRARQVWGMYGVFRGGRFGGFKGYLGVVQVMSRQCERGV
jgi:hypothetical protein